MSNDRGLEAVQKLRSAVDDTEGMLKGIEGARMQLSSTADELRGQVTTIRERVRWLIQELDKVRAQIGRSTQPGDLR
jgi:uncharacterized coiled-coil DUF342 family protein